MDIATIKSMCKERGITITRLEDTLGYSRGSISKSASMSGERLYEISQYFGVPMEYIFTGIMPQTKEDKAILAIKEQNDVLMKAFRMQYMINQYYEQIFSYEEKLHEIRQEYLALFSDYEENFISLKRTVIYKQEWTACIIDASRFFYFFLLIDFLNI